MLEIARFSEPGTPVSLAELAAWTGITRRYLEQLVIPMRRAGLLRGRAGRRGGYSLTRDAADIRVGEVLAAAMGPITLVDCVAAEGACARAPRCECRPLWLLLNDRVRDLLDEHSLADLADPAWHRRARVEIERRRARRARAQRGKS